MQSTSGSKPIKQKRTGEDRIFTIPNLLSFIRLLLIPLFFVLYVCYEQTVAGTIIFAVAACTDWVDGKVARATGSVTRLGKILDPFVDRLLLIFGVFAVYLSGRLPAWILVLLLLRDIILGILTICMKKKTGNDLTVSYVGKFATAFMMVAFSMLMLNWPIITGLGLFEISWLPGFGAGQFCFGIFVAYVGVILQWITAGIYLYRGIRYGTTAAHRTEAVSGVKDNSKAEVKVNSENSAVSQRIDSDANTSGMVK